jgi:tRNA A-37 threonylcarbamoyl transferase component Bud32
LTRKTSKERTRDAYRHSQLDQRLSCDNHAFLRV